MLLLFWNLDTGKQQRLLVTGMVDIYMDPDGRAVRVRQNNKYAPAVAAIMTARAN